MFPGISSKVFNSVFSIPGLKGVVLETFGAGNVPTSEWLIDTVKHAVDMGIIILNITQCQGEK
jgi:L-asparaginase